MPKYSFKNDYSEGCHQNILDKLQETNIVQQDGYGDDQFSKDAIELIKNKCNSPFAHIYFVSGGTQVNLLVISSILKSFETVISAKTGHINVHEAGAIEATGHRIEVVPTSSGKLSPKEVSEVLSKFEDEHTPRPRMVYISNSTELGTIYTKNELSILSIFCKEHNLLLFMDGARLGSALASIENDLTLEDITRLTDVFYIGGTKNGALIGEAIVINNETVNRDFKFHIKQRGALLAKGRIVGIQFLELFKDNLFFYLGKHANKMASKIKESLQGKSISYLTNTSTNQIFPILENKAIDQLLKKWDFYVWEKVSPNTSAIRLVTSWATVEENVDEFIKDIQNVL